MKKNEVFSSGIKLLNLNIQKVPITKKDQSVQRTMGKAFGMETTEHETPDSVQCQVLWIGELSCENQKGTKLRHTPAKSLKRLKKQRRPKRCTGKLAFVFSVKSTICQEVQSHVKLDNGKVNTERDTEAWVYYVLRDV